MQRKNNFLISLQSSVGSNYQSMQGRNSFRGRPGMAIIMALVVIVTLATIMALSLSFTAETTKRTTDLYLHEQSILYSKSAAELALLEIAENGCQNTFNQNFDGIYDVNVTMRYVYTQATTNVIGTNCNEYISYIQTDEQNGSVLMDITVSTDEGTEPIRYFRRSIQKL
ncbi:hypothetical protein N9X61_00510 [Sulfurimonas sp.]|nr:hypothetical protein [Sulfurimonas sp.]